MRSAIGVFDLAEAMPKPDPAWQAEIETVALQVWAERDPAALKTPHPDF